MDFIQFCVVTLKYPVTAPKTSNNFAFARNNSINKELNRRKIIQFFSVFFLFVFLLICSIIVN